MNGRFRMKNIVALDRWLLSSSFTSTSTFFFPPKLPSTPHFGSNRIQASSTSNASIETGICKPLLSGRRASLFWTAFSLVMPCDSFNNAIAADVTFHLRDEIRNVLSKGKAAGVLRLVFHDAGTFEIDKKIGGMNGSVVFELDRPENKGLKKSVKILEKAKSQMHVVQPVSWADLIALAGAEAVSLCGGPSIPIKMGRIDSMVPDPVGKLPEESLDATSLKECFKRKGFTTQELVALSGAHTLGSKGFGNPTVFDNAYFKILMEKPWMSSAGMAGMVGLPSDRALVEDDECVRWISKYAEDQNLFFEDFKNAYVKLVNLGATWKKSFWSSK